MSKARDIADLDFNSPDIDGGNIDGATIGASTAAAGTFSQVNVDNITIDGTTIALSSGDLTLDVAGDIILDADGGDILIKDGGTQIGQISKSSSNSNFIVKSSVNDADLEFKGVDGGANITALTLDMSDAGTAYFNSGIHIPDFIYHAGDTHTYFGFNGGDQFELVTAGQSRMKLVGSETTFNEGGNDKDFRVESDGSTHALFVNGGTNRVGILNSSPAKPLEVTSNDFQIRLSTASDPTNYYTQFISAYDSTNPFRIQGYYNGTTVEFLKISAAGGFSGPILKLGEGMSYLSLYTGTTERISLQPTQGSIYENIHANVTGNFDLSFVRGQKFARAGSIANEVKSRIFLGSYTYSGGTIDYVITKSGGSQVHVGSGTINWYCREAVVHHTITGTNDSSQIVVNGNQYTTAGAADKFTISIRATNGDSHLTIQNRLGSTCHIGLRINVNYVG